MARSSWKPAFIHNDFIEQQKVVKNNSEIILYNRSTLITKQMVGLKVQVYNGLKFVPISITNDMLGFKLGEFSSTRKKHISPKKKIQQK